MITVIGMMIIVFLLFLWEGGLKKVVLAMPEYEESMVEDGEPGEEGERIDLAVIPDLW